MRFVGRFAYISPALAVLAWTVLPGCGGTPAGDVTGKVTLNGKAPDLDNLQICFLGQDGRPVTAPVARDGSFRATSVPAGQVKVGLAYLSPDGQAAHERAGKARTQSPEEILKGQRGKIDPRTLQPAGTSLRLAAGKNPIPESARDPRTSRKTIQVEAGKENSFTWDVRR